MNSSLASASARSLSVSLLKPICNFLFLLHSWPLGDNRLLCCQAAEPSEMEGMTTCVPSGINWGQTEEKDGRMEGQKKQRNR